MLAASTTRWLLTATLLALAPCADPKEAQRALAEPAPAPAVASAAGNAASPQVAAAAPLHEGPPSVRAQPRVAPVGPRMLEHLRAVVARDPTLANDVFAKMGGSSVVNRGFLHCFEDEPTLDLGGRPFDDTLRHFRAGRIGRTSPFGRTSRAASVGWSLRQAMGGRPSYVVQELVASRARFALVFFGSNDVEGRNAHQFAARLDRIVSLLEARGVVPILGATYPRRANDPAMNEQVRRYNRLSRALAEARALPYVDFHATMIDLPGRGLAADGYHPNTYVVGPRARGCDFGAEGLAHGNNQRNLATLEVLDAVRRRLLVGEPAESGEATPPGGQGTGAAPHPVHTLPFVQYLEGVTGEAAEPSSPCGAPPAGAVRTSYRLVLDAPARLRLSAVPMGEVDTAVRVVAAGRCVRAGGPDEVVALEPGAHTLEVLRFVPRRLPEDRLGQPARTLVVFGPEP